MRYLTVKNWSEFQHYKNRNPPWIKLHRAIVDDYAFTTLKDRTKAHLLMIWILAAGAEGKVPHDAKFIASRIGANEPLDIEAIIEAGFLIADDAPETTDQQTGEIKNKRPRVNGHAALTPEFAAFWSVYPRKVAKGDAEKAWAAIKPDATLAASIVSAVSRQLSCEQWTKDAGQFIPHPATWLNRKGWEDEPDVQINYGRCKYCSHPAVSKKNGIPHCSSHFDFAKQGA